MEHRDAYLCIDLERTGRRLERMMKRRGYSVKDIQDILHLSCPQPVYRWMRGQILPSVDHLFVLARVFSVHMEELVVVGYRIPEGQNRAVCSRRRRMSEYRRRYLRLEAA